jgi:hypothetical protein
MAEERPLLNYVKQQAELERTKSQEQYQNLPPAEQAQLAYGYTPTGLTQTEFEGIENIQGERSMPFAPYEENREEYQRLLYREQTPWELTGNTLGRTLLTAGSTTLGSFGLTDAQDSINRWAENTLPLYNTPEGSNWVGFADLFQSGVGSGLGFLVPGTAVAKVGSTLGRGVLSGLNALDKTKAVGVYLAANPQIAQRLGNITAYTSTAVGNRTIEGLMEAHGVYDQTFKQVLNRLAENPESINNVSPEVRKAIESEGLEINDVNIAKYIASEASSRSLALNYANIGFDFVQAAPLLRMVGYKSPTSSGIARNTLRGSSTSEVIEGMAGDVTKKRTWWISPRNLATQSVSEGAEEVVNYIAQEEGLNVGRELQGLPQRDFSEYITDSEALKSFLGGMLGGAFFGTVSDLGTVSQRKAEDAQQDLNTKLALSSFAQRQQKVYQAINSMEAVEENTTLSLDEKKLRTAEVKAGLMSDLAYQALSTDRVEDLKEQLSGDFLQKVFVDPNNPTAWTTGENIEKTKKHLIRELDEATGRFNGILNSVKKVAAQQGVQLNDETILRNPTLEASIRNLYDLSSQAASLDSVIKRYDSTLSQKMSEGGFRSNTQRLEKLDQEQGQRYKTLKALLRESEQEQPKTTAEKKLTEKKINYLKEQIESIQGDRRAKGIANPEIKDLIAQSERLKATKEALTDYISDFDYSEGSFKELDEMFNAFKDRVSKAYDKHPIQEARKKQKKQEQQQRETRQVIDNAPPVVEPVVPKPVIETQEVEQIEFEPEIDITQEEDFYKGRLTRSSLIQEVSEPSEIIFKFYKEVETTKPIIYPEVFENYSSLSFRAAYIDFKVVLEPVGHNVNDPEILDILTQRLLKQLEGDEGFSIIRSTEDAINEIKDVVITFNISDGFSIPEYRLNQKYNFVNFASPSFSSTFRDLIEKNYGDSLFMVFPEGFSLDHSSFYKPYGSPKAVRIRTPKGEETTAIVRWNPAVTSDNDIVRYGFTVVKEGDRYYATPVYVAVNPERTKSINNRAELDSNYIFSAVPIDTVRDFVFQPAQTSFSLVSIPASSEIRPVEGLKVGGKFSPNGSWYIPASFTKGDLPVEAEGEEQEPEIHTIEAPNEEIRFRLADEATYDKINETEAKAWFEKRFPYVPLEFIDNFISYGGNVAYGMFKDASVVLSRAAESGTEYHEAFHVAFNLFSSDKTRKNVLKEVKDRFNLKDTSDLDVEENLAEQFREYVQTGSIGFKRGKIEKFFDKLLNFIYDVLGLGSRNIAHMFDRIQSGYKGYQKPLTPQMKKFSVKFKLLPGLTYDAQNDIVNAASGAYVKWSKIMAKPNNINQLHTNIGYYNDYINKLSKAIETNDSDFPFVYKNDIYRKIVDQVKQVAIGNPNDFFAGKGLNDKQKKERIKKISEAIVWTALVHRLKLTYSKGSDQNSIYHRQMIENALASFVISDSGSSLMDMVNSTIQKEFSLSIVDDLLESEEGGTESNKDFNDINYIKQSQRQSLPKEIKELLKTLPLMDRNGNRIMNPWAATDQFLNFSETYATLERNLVGASSLYEMYKIIEAMSVAKPSYQDLINQLQSDPLLEDKFYNHFNKFYQNLTYLIEKNYNTTINGEKINTKVFNIGSSHSDAFPRVMGERMSSTINWKVLLNKDKNQSIVLDLLKVAEENTLSGKTNLIQIAYEKLGFQLIEDNTNIIGDALAHEAQRQTEYVENNLSAFEFLNDYAKRLKLIVGVIGGEINRAEDKDEALDKVIKNNTARFRELASPFKLYSFVFASNVLLNVHKEKVYPMTNHNFISLFFRDFHDIMKDSEQQKKIEDFFNTITEGRSFAQSYGLVYSGNDSYRLNNALATIDKEGKLNINYNNLEFFDVFPLDGIKNESSKDAFQYPQLDTKGYTLLKLANFLNPGGVIFKDTNIRRFTRIAKSVPSDSSQSYAIQVPRILVNGYFAKTYRSFMAAELKQENDRILNFQQHLIDNDLVSFNEETNSYNFNEFKSRLTFKEIQKRLGEYAIFNYGWKRVRGKAVPGSAMEYKTAVFGYYVNGDKITLNDRGGLLFGESGKAFPITRDIFNELYPTQGQTGNTKQFGYLKQYYTYNLNNIVRQIDPSLSSIESNKLADNKDLIGLLATAGVIGKDNYFVDTAMRYSGNIKSSKNDVNLAIRFMIEEFFINDLIHRTETFRYIDGLPNFFKGERDATKRFKTSISPYNPQMPLSIERHTKPEERKSGFDIVIIEDIEKEGTLFNNKDIPSDLRKFYKDVNTADAQSWFTPSGFFTWLKGKGLWKEEFNNEDHPLQKLKRGNQLTKAEQLWIKENRFAESIKPLYRATIFNSAVGDFVPQNVKTSIKVLWPNEVKGTPMAEILDKLNEQGVDMLVTESAAKFGFNKMHSLVDENGNLNTDFEDMKINTPYEYWGEQLSVPDHSVDTTNKFGTQMRNFIMSNILDDAEYTVGNRILKGKDLKDWYYNLVQQNTQRSLDNLLGELTTEGQIDLRKVQDLLLSELESRNTSENIKEALEIVQHQLKERFLLPLDAGSISAKMQAVLTSLFTNQVINQKVPGFSAVLVSDAFMDVTPDKAKTILEEGYTGGTRYTKEYLERAAKGDTDLKYYIEDGNLVAEAILPAYSEAFIDENGYVTDLDALPKELLEVIVYRIPTEGKQSIDRIKVVGMGDFTMGSSIIIARDLIAKTGADFDVDKVFAFHERVIKEGDKITFSLDTQGDVNNHHLLEVVKSVVSSEHHRSETLSPSGFDTIKEVLKELEKASGKKRDDIAVHSSDDTTVMGDNTAGIPMKGSANNLSVAIALAQQLKLYFTKGSITVQYGNKLHNKDGKLITQQVSEFVAAILDVAKDPTIAYWGGNEKTLPYAAFLVSTGNYNMKEAILLAGSSYVQEFTQMQLSDEKNITGNDKNNIKLEEYLNDKWAELDLLGVDVSKAIKEANMWVLNEVPKAFIQDLFDIKVKQLKGLELTTEEKTKAFQAIKIYSSYKPINDFVTQNLPTILKIGSASVGPSLEDTNRVINRIKDLNKLYEKGKIISNIIDVFVGNINPINRMFSTYYKVFNKANEVLSPLFISYQDNANSLINDIAGTNRDKRLHVRKELLSYSLNDFVSGPYHFRLNTEGVNDDRVKLLGYQDKAMTPVQPSQSIVNIDIEKFRGKTFMNKLMLVHNASKDIAFSDLSGNAFFDAVVYQPNVKTKNNKYIHRVIIRQDSNDAASSDMITAGIMEIYLKSKEQNNPYKEYYEALLVDMLRYEYLTNGFTFGAQSLTRYIPTQMLNDIGLSGYIENIDFSKLHSGHFTYWFYANNGDDSRFRNDKIPVLSVQTDQGFTIGWFADRDTPVNEEMSVDDFFASLSEDEMNAIENNYTTDGTKTIKEYIEDKHPEGVIPEREVSRYLKAIAKRMVEAQERTKSWDNVYVELDQQGDLEIKC